MNGTVLSPNSESNRTPKKAKKNVNRKVEPCSPTTPDGASPRQKVATSSQKRKASKSPKSAARDKKSDKSPKKRAGKKTKKCEQDNSKLPEGVPLDCNSVEIVDRNQGKSTLAYCQNQEIIVETVNEDSDDDEQVYVDRVALGEKHAKTVNCKDDKEQYTEMGRSESKQEREKIELRSEKDKKKTSRDARNPAVNADICLTSVCNTKNLSQKRKASESPKSGARNKKSDKSTKKRIGKKTKKIEQDNAKLPEGVPLDCTIVEIVDSKQERSPFPSRQNNGIVETRDEDSSEGEQADADCGALGEKHVETVNGKEDKKHDTSNEKAGCHDWKDGKEKIEPLSEEEEKNLLRDAREYLNADIRLISACKDEQQTSDCSNVVMRFSLRRSQWGSQASGFDGGACTSALLKILYEDHKDPDSTYGPKWIDLLHRVRAQLKVKGYKQIPALTSSRPFSMKDEFNIIPKNHNGKKRALIIGIRYKGMAWELPGCHNDCHNMIKYLKTIHGFTDDDITILMDDGVHVDPTRDNIIKAFHRFAFSAKAGDAAFFHFSGHGSSKVDASGDEASGFDQTLMPVDGKENGDIIDDDIFRILLVPLPRGLQLTAIVDCCHSGTIFDLPFEFIGDTDYETSSEMNLRKVTFPHMEMVRAERRRIHSMKKANDTASFIERKIMEPPATGKATKMGTFTEEPNNATMEHEIKVAVPLQEEQEVPNIERKRRKDSVSLILLGCLLVCLNPMRLFR